MVERPLVAVCQEISQDDHQMLLNPDVFIGGKEMIIKVAVPHQFKLRVIPDFRTLFFPDKKDIHYIGGSEILPAPLDTEEEAGRSQDLGARRRRRPKRC